MFHNISLSSLVTVKGRIPFSAWVHVKIIMYPFTFPIKEYGDEMASQQGVHDTRHSHKCICLAMLSQSGHPELSQL